MGTRSYCTFDDSLEVHWQQLHGEWLSIIMMKILALKRFGCTFVIIISSVIAINTAFINISARSELNQLKTAKKRRKKNKF